VRQIEPEHLDAANLAGVERLLIKTDNSALWDNPGHPFYEDFVALTAGAAQWCVDHGIKLVGIDYLSVELFHAAEPEVHRLLLRAGIVPVEGLDLRAVGPGDYHLICLPMKIAGSDGAPARVLLLERPPF
jgi:arylformamidase